MPKLRIALSSESLNSRDTWINRFQALLTHSPDEMNDEWAALMKSLRLSLDCYFAVLEVLKQGRWANADYPIAYVRYASIIEARKMGLLTMHSDDNQDYRKHESYRSEAPEFSQGIKPSRNSDRSAEVKNCKFKSPVSLQNKRNL